MKVSAVIPTLNPDERILAVVAALKEEGFERIIIVNDGSDPACDPIFRALAADAACVVLLHRKNRGKGYALRTALRYFTANPLGEAGVITLDDDGQHTAADAAACARALGEHPKSLIMGARDFSSRNKQVPFKSRIGNRLTSAVFRFACGLAVTDTQTGLRGIPAELVPVFLEVRGDRFEYETNMLLACREQHIPLFEVPISTIYIEENKGTHFHFLRDSWRIYKLLLKFILSSGLAFLVDFALFWLLGRILPIESTTKLVFAATVGARAVSSLVNYFTNRRVVFAQKGSLTSSMPRYYALCVVQGLASSALVSLFSNLLSPDWMLLWKLLVDGGLFLLSFRIQESWVFAERPAKGGLAPVKKAPNAKPAAPLRLIWRSLAVFGLVLGFLLLLLLGGGAVICRGPSPAARDLFVASMMETSAAKFVPRIYLSAQKVDEIMRANAVVISAKSVTDDTALAAPLEEGFDLAAISVHDVKGATFVGKMMVVNDPSRLFAVTLPQFDVEGPGMDLRATVAEYDAVAGLNGGGFYDPEGRGQGGMPLGIVIHKGELLCDTPSRYPTVIGFDGNHKLVIGNLSAEQALARGVQEAVSFGPVLVVNGERASFAGVGSGLNPRSAIGQRADGAVLLLVVDGRQPHSLGATYGDIADVMLEFGAINAANLDGGSSSMLYYEGKLLNSLSSFIGERRIPTAFLVKKAAEVSAQ